MNSVKLQYTKLICRNLFHFCILTTNSQKEKWRKHSHLLWEGRTQWLQSGCFFYFNLCISLLLLQLLKGCCLELKAYIMTQLQELASHPGAEAEILLFSSQELSWPGPPLNGYTKKLTHPPPPPPEPAWHGGDPGLIPGLGRPPGGGNGNPLQYSCLESLTDRGAWRATVHGATKSRTRVEWLSVPHWHQPNWQNTLASWV